MSEIVKCPQCGADMHLDTGREGIQFLRCNSEPNKHLAPLGESK